MSRVVSCNPSEDATRREAVRQIRAVTSGTREKYKRLRAAGRLKMKHPPGDNWTSREIDAVIRGKCDRKRHNFTDKNLGYNALGWYSCKACFDKASSGRRATELYVLRKIEEMEP